MSIRQVVAVGLVFGMAASALGGGLGDKAPGLHIQEWVKGEPVVLSRGKGTNIYVLEFWLTTCLHSRGTIPFMTQLQEDYKDQGVVVVSISPEQPDVLKTFVEEQGGKIGYCVGADRNLSTFQMYLRGVGAKTTPLTFIVDKEGNLVWYGHPMGGLKKALDEVVAGTYDIEVCRKRDQARKRLDGYFTTASSPKYAEGAHKIGEKIIEDGQVDVILMNEFAWEIATRPGLIKRDLELAMKAAKIAYDGCEGKDAGILDTYAKVLWESGKQKEAIEIQRKAITLTDVEEFRKGLEKNLAKYEKAIAED